MLDCDKGQTKHLSSMSSLRRTRRINRWMTPTSTNVLIRPFLNLFFATDVLRTTSNPLNSTPSTSVTATKRLQTVKPRGLSHADCQVGAWDFSVVRASENWENWFLAKVPNSMPSLHRKVCFKCLNWLIILIYCSKKELSTLVPNPLLSSAQRTHHSVLGALGACRTLHCCRRKWYWA